MTNWPYDTPEWDHARTRALSRDGNRCSVGRLLGGTCHATLHVHHLDPVREGGAPFDLDNLITACASHHPAAEAFRREVLRRLNAEAPKCPHFHPYPAGRAACEARMRRSVAA